MLPPGMGSLLEFENSRGEVAFRTYITGDTVFFDELKEIPRRFPDIDLALLHLGGTMFFGLLMVTMDPKQGVEVIRLVKPKTAIPIHYDDYTAFEFALGDNARPTADPPEWWRRTQITSFEEFITMAKEASPGSDGAYPAPRRDIHFRGPREPSLTLLCRGEALSQSSSTKSVATGTRQAAHRHAPAALAEIIAVVPVGQIAEGDSGRRISPSDLSAEARMAKRFGRVRASETA